MKTFQTDQVEENESLPLAQRLRSIGQALEDLRVQDFELETDGDDFVVRGQAAPKVVEPPILETKASSAGGLRRLFGGSAPRQPEPPPPPPEPTVVDLRFTPEDISLLDSNGRTKRQETAAMPDFYSVPQVLRTIGDYLERLERKLLRVERQGATVTIEYETAYGETGAEERTAASLYELSVRMYLRRSER